MSGNRILLVSNGHGEDAIAVRLAREFDLLGTRLGHGFNIMGLPLVGPGAAYRNAEIPVVGLARALPSGGWGLRSPRRLFRDLRAGLLQGLADAIASVQEIRPALCVGVGDLLPVAIAAVGGVDSVLVGCNKTDFYTRWGESYVALEIAALKIWGTEVFPRDLLTHRRLRQLGVWTKFLGNPMADLVSELPQRGIGVALLPGSRSDAHENLLFMVETLGRLSPAVPAKVALAPGMEALARVIEAQGIPAVSLEEALSDAAIALATAGTAAEVAAAHGRVVISFPGPGPQYTNSFATRQKELLGAALILCSRDPDELARAIRRATQDTHLQNAAREAGRLRVGVPGASRAIAREIVSRFGASDA